MSPFRVLLVLLYASAVYVVAGPLFQLSARERSPKGRAITVVRLSPNGGMLAVGRADGSVEMWDTKGREQLWISRGDWRMTRRIVAGQGDRLSPSIVDLLDLPLSKRKSMKNPAVLGIFFLREDLELLIVERDGGLRRLLSDDGSLLGSYGVFFGVKRDKQLEGIVTADVNPNLEVLAIAGSLSGMPYEVDLRKLEETQTSTSYVCLEDNITVLDIESSMPAATFNVALPHIQRSVSASKPMTHSGGGMVTDLKYCSHNDVLVGITDDGKMIGWKRTGDELSTKPAYVRIGFRDSKGGVIDPGVASSDQALVSTTPAGRYGNVQFWNTDKGELGTYFNQANTSFRKKLAIDRSGTLIVTECESGVALWHLEDAEMKRLGSVALISEKDVRQQNQFVRGVAISDDGTTLAIADDETIFVFDLPRLTGERRFGSTDSKTRTQMDQ